MAKVETLVKVGILHSIKLLHMYLHSRFLAEPLETSITKFVIGDFIVVCNIVVEIVSWVNRFKQDDIRK